jgi:hypothetical protein
MILATVLLSHAFMLEGALFAAPMPPEPLLDLSGAVAEAKWFPAEALKGVPGMSGSAGHDRIFPAHFLVVLKDYDGISSGTAKRISYYVEGRAAVASRKGGGPTVTLRLNHENRDWLRPGMRIRLRGYQVRGDEGGTWTAFHDLEILEKEVLPPGDRKRLRQPG